MKALHTPTHFLFCFPYKTNVSLDGLKQPSAQVMIQIVREKHKENGRKCAWPKFIFSKWYFTPEYYLGKTRFSGSFKPLFWLNPESRLDVHIIEFPKVRRRLLPCSMVENRTPSHTVPLYHCYNVSDTVSYPWGPTACSAYRNNAQKTKLLQLQVDIQKGELEHVQKCSKN